MEERDRPGESKVGQRRVLTTWAVGEAWERFCTTRKEVIIRSFCAIGLALPIDGTRDSEMSVKGIDMERLVEDMKEWHIGGLEQPTLDGNASSEEEESLPSEDNDNEFIDYEAEPLRAELEELE